jgi:hypothetical protein
MKRVVCLLLVPAVLLTQRAGLGHFHGGRQPAGHDFRPHIHTNLTSSCHGHDGHHHHGHHHGSGGHHHHDADEGAEPDAALAPLPEPLSDHDSDAVYISAVYGVGRPRSGDDITRVAPGVAPELAMIAGCLGVLPERSMCRSRPPPLCGSTAHPLYIRHLALLL